MPSTKHLWNLIWVVPALILFFGSFGIIGPGERGVVVTLGHVTGEIKGEGLYFKAPLITSVNIMNVRQQKEQVETQAASNDLQMVDCVIALNLTLNPSRAAWVFQNIGRDYLQTVVAPAMQEAIKAVTAQYTAQELVSKREQVRLAIDTLIASKLTPLGVTTNALNIVNLQFSESFNQAIEAKVTAEQNALAAKNKLDQVTYEAEQAVAKAKGDAEAIRVEGDALKGNPQLVQLRAIEKWNGELPQYTGGTMPFLQIKN